MWQEYRDSRGGWGSCERVRVGGGVAEKLTRREGKRGVGTDNQRGGEGGVEAHKVKEELR